MHADSDHFNARRRTGRPLPTARRGLTLVESLIAAVLLVTVVTAVLGALSAGHQHAMEAKRLITASLAAEQLMARVTATPYSDLGQWNGWQEDPGTGTTAELDQLPDLFELIGRRVTISPSTQQLDQLQVTILGSVITVESFDDDGRTLTRLVRFIPEPQV